MGNQWVRELETVAHAVISDAELPESKGGTCRHCGAKAASTDAWPEHTESCPVAVARRILDQATFMRAARPLI